MELPELDHVDDVAADIVGNVLFDAKRKFGERMSTTAITRSVSKLRFKPRLSLSGGQRPLAARAEALIRTAVEHRWALHEHFRYCVKYVDCTADDAALYYYYEAIFSQPTPQYPVPQVTASVFFRIRDDKTDEDLPPTMSFRVEGCHSEHDAARAAVKADQLFATLKIKADVFRNIEEIGVF